MHRKVDVRRVYMTPAEAKWLLSTQRRNRKINTAQVNLFAKIMSAGEWGDSNDMICVTTDGVLINGQHRLAAVVKSGHPVWMDVKYGADPELIADRGRPRRVDESIYMRGIVSTELAEREVVQIANRMILAYRGASQTGGKLADYEIEDFLTKYGDTALKAREICENKRNASTSVTRRAPIRAAMFAALMCGVREDILLEFAEVANTGFMSNESQSAAIVMRNYIFNNNTGGRANTDRLHDVAECAIRDFANGTPRRKTYTKATKCFTEKLRKENKLEC